MLYLTLDQDFCKEEELKLVFDLITKYETKITLFVTNESPLIDDYRNDLIELGIHPNFLTLLHPKSRKTQLISLLWKEKRNYLRFVRKSRQGKSVEEVFDNCMNMVAKAKLMRSHYLVTSGTIFREAAKRGIKCDLSLFIPNGPVLKFSINTPSGLFHRISYNFEDSYFLEYFSSFDGFLPSMKDAILTFHPVYIYSIEKVRLFFENMIANNQFSHHISTGFDLNEGASARAKNG